MHVKTGKKSMKALTEEVKKLAPWFHRYEFNNKIITGQPDKKEPTVRMPGDPMYQEAVNECHQYTASFSRVANILARFVGPSLLKPKALEIAAHTGLFSFQMANAGFRDILTTDIRDHPLKQGEYINSYVKAPMTFRHVPVSLDDPAYPEIGTYNVVACLGVLYHLRDLLQGLRNLRAVTKDVLLVQSLLYNSTEPLIWLYDEDPNRMVCGVDTIAQHPSRSALICLLRQVGFDNVIEVPAIGSDPLRWRQFGTFICY